ncbi:MAG: cation:proton antiporter [Patescibacteria group bacterium]
MHSEFAGYLLWIGGAILTTVVFGAVAKRFHQPRVLGALIGGLIIGMLFSGTDLFRQLRSTHGIPFIAGLAEIAAMLLLFKAGLEGNLHSIIQDARQGWKVACIGVIVPVIGGFAYTMAATHVAWPVALFQGGVFAATSVGITVAVLQELGVIHKRYARTIISAAVIDDVLGLLILTVCDALNSSEDLAVGAVSIKIGQALLFVGIVPVLGHRLAPPLLRALNRLNEEAREAIVLSFLFLYGAAALSVGLAAIVGAYFAGVALEEVYFIREDKPVHEKSVEGFIDSLIVALGPIFFVYAGCIVDPQIFLSMSVLVIGITFTVIAVVGKLACGLVVSDNRLLIGVGMVPRGEVGIVFATIGFQKGILTPELFGASMIMVLLTTMLTPILLKRVIDRAS